MSRIGDFIKDRRRLLNMSQQILADKVGVSKSAISRYESGEIGNMGVDKAKKLARALRVDPLIFVETESVRQSKRAIFVDDDFEIYSSSRRLQDNAEPFVRKTLLSMTEPLRVEEATPTRAEILDWLAENIRTAAFGGGNYEEMDDQSLYEYYMDIRKEVDDEERRN